MINYTNKLFVSVPEMMELTGLSRSEINKYMEDGTIPYIHVGKGIKRSTPKINVVCALEALGIKDIKISNKHLQVEEN